METERLILDGIRAEDKEDYFNNISHDRKVLETFICRYAESLETFDFSAYLTAYRENNRLFAIRLKETGRLIGILICFDETETSCEIGYGIGSGYWGRGYATEAVGRFLEYLFSERGFRTVYASFFTGNDASRRVMEKCGMVYDRFSEKELTYLGIERDLTYYAIRRDTDAVLLNGPSSAGKSSIAEQLRRKLGVTAVTVTLDDYLEMSVREPIWED
ncbi:MAG: GNAT family N-acetyltransferase, partial [Lachnospiraceae bacterium]|nr:GNAT family N-acetyltransferase [Lachnospiraceae bacterium]